MLRSMKRVSERQHWTRFWNRERTLDEIYDNDDRIRTETSRLLNLKDYLLLEVGAATARDSISLAREGAFPVALDYIPEALRRAGEAAENSGINILLVCGDARYLPFRKNIFDMVFHQGVLEHFRRPEDILFENVRVLKPDGILLVDVPQTFHIYTVIKKFLIAVNKWFAGWETQFTLKDLEKLLHNAGLEPFARYGRFFSPSLLYRVIREIIQYAGLRLPLRPVIIKPVYNLRKRLRTCIEGSSIGPRFGCVIGVFARKPEKKKD